MTRKKKKRESLAPRQIIDRFVWRARRVEAHSLVQSGDVERYAKRRETYSITTEGVSLVSDNVPADEEAVESLAGRLRPFIVQSEPIYLAKVFKSLDELMPADSLTKEEREVYGSVKGWFERRYVNKNEGLYTIQVFDKDGNPHTKRMSDSLLAESWLYTDYVHADPNDEKAEATKVDYIVRYRAASTYFCEFALQVLSLLNLVRGLTKKGLVRVSEFALKSPVIYSTALAVAGNQRSLGRMFFLPPDADLSTGVDLANVPGAINVSSLVAGETSSDKGAHFAVFDVSGKLMGLYPAQYDASGEKLTIVIGHLLKLSVLTKLGLQGQAVEAPFDLEIVGEATDGAEAIAESLRYPNYAELVYTEGEGQRHLRMQPKPMAASN